MENIKVPDQFEQAARINELRDISGLKKYKLGFWLRFQRAIMEYYEPFILEAQRAKKLEEELEAKKREIERISQGSLFND